MEEGRLPTLSRLAGGESAKGDLIAVGYRSDAEVLASVVTGRLTHKHEIHHPAQFTQLREPPQPMRRTVWEWIESRGGRVAAIGFPFGSTVRRSSRPGLASDRRTALLAAEILRSQPDRHLFVYLDGLQAWTRSSGAGGAPLHGYYEELDRILERLTAAGEGSPTTWMLFSERGNPDGPIDYRPRFPRLRTWPPIGFFMAWGHGVKRSVEPHTLSPVDLAATLTYIGGYPIPNDTDGVVLFGLLDDGYYFQQRLAFRP